MEEETQRKKCLFFDICAAYIIREKIENYERFKTGESTKKWSERFCFADFEKCEHYQDGGCKQKERGII